MPEQAVPLDLHPAKYVLKKKKKSLKSSKNPITKCRSGHLVTFLYFIIHIFNTASGLLLLFQ